MSEYPLCAGLLLRRELRPTRARGRAGGRAPGAVRPAALRRQSRPIDYAPNDLSCYANIPVPLYMCMGTQEDFFGGYDHAAGGHRSRCQPPHLARQEAVDLGQSRVRLRLGPQPRPTSDGPYIEIMAGVYTDNQPDFCFLQPGETKTWSQFWYPIQKIGPPQHANLDAAVSLRVRASEGATRRRRCRRFPARPR